MIKRGLSSRGILRGTSLATLLGGFGHRLRTTSGRFGSVVDATENDYARSFQVQNLDFFLSHSWQANWWLKYTALLFYFNSIPASVAAMGAGILCAVLLLRGDPTVDEGWLQGEYRRIDPCCFAAGAGAYAVVLFGWHHLTALVPPRWGSRWWQPTVFLDKICINQVDAREKELGIRSIGGILARSSNFLVAWDATYFSRLWCTYEISAFMHCQRGGSLILLPISFGALSSIILFGEIAAGVLSYICWWRLKARLTLGILDNLYVASWFFVSLFSFMILRRCAEDLVTLDAQLAEFSIEKTQCFCCMNEHVNPATGDSLPCDRKLVYDDIAMYEGLDGQDGLEAFNSTVRTSFREGVRRSFGGSARLRYYMVLSASVFNGLVTLDCNLESRPPWWVFAYRMVFYTFFFLPNLFGLLMIAARHSWHMPKAAWQKRLWDFGIALAFAGLAKLMFLTDIQMSPRGDSLAALWLLANAASTYLLYFRRRCAGGRCRSTRCQAEDPQPVETGTASTCTEGSEGSSEGSVNV